MALILKAKNTTFENYITNFQPASNPSNWFDFGADEAKSTTNLAGGPPLSLINPAGAVSYGPSYVTLPQAASASDFFRTNTVNATKLSFAAHIRPGGQYERVYTVPVTTQSIGILIGSDGVLVHTVLLSDGSTGRAEMQLLARPAAIVGTIEEDDVAGEVSISVYAAYPDGEIRFATNTIAGTLDAVYAGTAIDIGRNNTGELVMSEAITYDRVLTSDEINKTLSYLGTKYS